MWLIEDVAEMFADDWAGKLLGVVIIVLVLMLLALVGGGIFYLVDSVGRPVRESSAVINGFTYTAEYTSIIQVGAVMVPTTYDATWGVSLDVNGKGAWYAVNESYYNSAKKGDIVYVTYTKGRLRNKLYIKTLRTSDG